MLLGENVRLAVNGLLANKMRALLTMLGIIIGISSVIAIVTVGQAMTGSVTNLMNDLGANSIQIYLQDKPDEFGNTDYTREWEDDDRISDQMIESYLEAFSGKVSAWAVSSGVGSGQAMNGRNQASGEVVGTNSDALKIQNIPIIAGHFLNEREVGGMKYAAVISDRFVEKLFPGMPMQQALGKEIKIRLNQGIYTFTVVGVYHFEVKGFLSNVTGDTTTTVFIPITLAKQITGSTQGVHYGLQIKGSDQVTNSKLFAEQTAKYFNDHFYRNNKYVIVMAESMDSMIGQMTGMMNTMSIAISIIAGISLLVGGIGVMNIMLVSVTERTREIGTRKALGAKNSAIQIQFIVESMIICLIGGVIGVALGTALGLTGSSLLGFPGWPSPGIVFIAVSFSMAIGVFFGYYPANKASKLDPIEALRYE
ncbi:MAG: transporter permease [Oscillospiraceae bacterium]|jgi:putative ABC transport system permease protein|nr:transporter permease [Oscillospiraceae bacterium]